MTNKPLTEKEKQFTILPNEADPKTSMAKAHQAVQKALSQVKKTKRPKSQYGKMETQIGCSNPIYKQLTERVHVEYKKVGNC